MEPTAKLLPKSEELKKHIRLPLGIAISPTKAGIAHQINAKQENLCRCKSCQAYLNPHCEVKDGKWACSICSRLNEYVENDISKQQLENENYQVIINKTPDFDEIFCLYISLDFEESEFQRNKLAAVGILRHIPENCPCMIFVGIEDSQFALLVPPQPQKSYKLTAKGEEVTENEINSCFRILKKQCNVEETKPIAAFAKFANADAFIGIDLSHFFFWKNSIPAAERAIERLSYAKDPKAVIKSVELTATMGRVLQGTPVRFISMVNSISRVPPILDMIKSMRARLDYVVTYFTKQINDISKQLPGSVFILSSENPGGQGAHIAQQKTSYSLVTRCRAHNCATEWKQLPAYCSEVDDQVLFVPAVTVEEHPFAIDIVPMPNQTKIVFQVTAKYVANDEKKPGCTSFIFRVMSLCLETSTNEEEIVNSINWNCVIWFWSHVVHRMLPSEAISSLMRAAAAMIANIGVEKTPTDFQRGICGLRYLWVFNEDPVLRYIGWQMLSQTVPSKLNMIAKKIVVNERTILLTADCVEEKGTVDGFASAEARIFQSELPIYLPIRPEINPSLENVDEKYSAILSKLVKSLTK